MHHYRCITAVNLTVVRSSIKIPFLLFIFSTFFRVELIRGEEFTVAVHCLSDIRTSGNITVKRIDCHIDSNDPDAITQWSLMRSDGTTEDLGQCQGNEDSTCSSVTGPVESMSRFHSWSNVVLTNPESLFGSYVVCAVTNYGQRKYDRCLLKDDSSGGSSSGSRYECDSTNGRPTSMTEEEFLSQCCKVKQQRSGFTVSRFSCESGCCGEKDDQSCCLDDTEIGIIAGCSVAGALVLIGLIILLVWVFRKARGGYSDHKDHRKLLKEVYSVATFDELFVTPQPLVSAPGTVVHPVSNVNGPYAISQEGAYVMPALDQVQVLPSAPSTAPVRGDTLDEDEENWDRWDGFPASTDHVGISGIEGSQSAGRGRDNPLHGEGEGGGRDQYYYDNYNRYTEPPPGYNDVTN